ncbi:hypothetical protein M9Y10_019303 [Tritrichomonas musculus]|uniref:Raptor N-terminal CASPase-like domain-containing protein n=1 Tax=Tritrichomonas musculus TaxID=1915356 RepID=A0ABR2HJ26_9EUKA
MNALPKSSPVNFQVIDDGFGSSDDGGENYQYFEEAVWQKLQIDETIPDLSPMFEKFPNLSPNMPSISDITAQDISFNHFNITDDEFILDNCNPSTNPDGSTGGVRSRNNSIESTGSLGISGAFNGAFANNINLETIECVVVNVAHLEQFPKAVSPYSATLPCIFSWFDAHTAFSSEFPTTVQNYFKITYNLIKQHLRFFFSIAPSQERLNNLSSVRREVPSGRILFHYIGYGFPDIGKKNIWCSERRSREFVPFKLETLFERLHPPTWYIFDCNNASVVIKEFKETAQRLTDASILHRHRQMSQYDNIQTQSKSFSQGVPNDILLNSSDSGIDWNDWFCICASSADEELPDDPRLPRDFLTSTVLTPIKMAAICHMLQFYRLNLVNPSFPLDPPCSHLWNEKSPEAAKLAHALTAITDGIASDSLSPELYHKLFRCDMLAASLFRHFLLAQYLLRPYRVHPVSYPEIPDLSMHPMWRQWAILLDTAICAVSIPRPSFNVDLFSRAATTFEVLMKNGQFDFIRPYHISLLFHSLLSDPMNDLPIVLLSEYAKDKRSSPGMLASSTIFSPLFSRLMSLNPTSLVFYHLCYLILFLLYFNSSFANDITKEADASHFPYIAFNRELPEKTRIIAAALVANLVVSHEKFQQICTSNDYLDKVREELAFPNSRPSLSVWLMLSIRRAFNLYSPDPAVFTENALHLQCAVCTCSEAQTERAAAISVLTCFLRPFECKCNSQILFMSLFSAVKDASFLVRFHLVLLLKKFVMSFDSFSDAVKCITTLDFDSYHSLINSIYNCSVTNFEVSPMNDQDQDQTQDNNNENQNNDNDNNHNDNDNNQDNNENLNNDNDDGVDVDIKNNISVFERIDTLMHDDKVSGKAYAVSIALLQMLSNDPHPSVSSLSHTVLQFVSKQRNAYENSMNEYGGENGGSDDIDGNPNASNDSVGMFLNASVSPMNTDQCIVSYGDDEFEAEHLSFANLDQNESLHQSMLRNLIIPSSGEQQFQKIHNPNHKKSFYGSTSHSHSREFDMKHFLSLSLSNESINLVDFDPDSLFFAAATNNTVYCSNLEEIKEVYHLNATESRIVSLSVNSVLYNHNEHSERHDHHNNNGNTDNNNNDKGDNNNNNKDGKLFKNNIGAIRPHSLPSSSQSPKNIPPHRRSSLIPLSRKVFVLFATENGCVYIWCPPKKTPEIVFRCDPQSESLGNLFAFFIHDHKDQEKPIITNNATNNNLIDNSAHRNCDNLYDSFCVTVTKDGVISRWCLGSQLLVSEFPTDMRVISAFCNNKKSEDSDFCSILLSNEKNESFIYELSSNDEDSKLVPLSINSISKNNKNISSIFKTILLDDVFYIAYNDGSIIRKERKDNNEKIKKLIDIKDTFFDFSVSEDESIIVVCPTNNRPHVYFASNKDSNIQYKSVEINEVEKGISCMAHKSREGISFMIGDESGNVFLFSHNYKKE